MTLLKFIKYIQKSLIAVENPRLEAELIASSLTNLSRTELYLYPDKTVSEIIIKKSESFIEKRNRNYPLQYILGYVDFYDTKIAVDPNVLIPRHETELLVDIIINENRKNKLKILDLCTGSGAIAIAIKNVKPLWNVHASDISQNALHTAKDNALNNSVNIKFISSNLFNNIDEKYDIIVSNPPYISPDEYKKLAPELFYEPENALIAKDDGLYFYNQILDNIADYLNPNAKIYLEVGDNQSELIRNIAARNLFSSFRVKKDYNNFDRFVIIEKK